METKKIYEELIARAMEARKNAYAPYSHFLVGAALLTKEGKIFPGCNIENAAFSGTNCAERTAIFSAVAVGEKHFDKIAIVGSPDTELGDTLSQMAFPCGFCRQVMNEFCNRDTFEIIVAKSVSDYEVYTLKELLPKGFGPADLDY